MANGDIAEVRGTSRELMTRGCADTLLTGALPKRDTPVGTRLVHQARIETTVRRVESAP